MGFEGFAVYDVSTILGNNPSRKKCEFTELPAFKIPTYDVVLYTEEELHERLRKVAAQLTDKEYFRSNTDYNTGEVVGRAGDMTLFANIGWEGIRVEFEIPVDIPDEYGIYNARNEDMEQIEASLEYLGEKYGEIFGMTAPVPDFGFCYDIYDYAGGDAYLYDDSEDPLTALMNYNFKRLSFQGKEVKTDIPIQPNSFGFSNPYDGTFKCTGDLESIHYGDRLSFMDFMGMYPVISYDEAYSKLIGGDYFTTVWEEYYLPDGINPDEVFFEGINYKRTSDYKYELPYYTFLIELHPERTGDYVLTEGMREYGRFYVPAISPEYLVVDTTDVSFN